MPRLCTRHNSYPVPVLRAEMDWAVRLVCQAVSKSATTGRSCQTRRSKCRIELLRSIHWKIGPHPHVGQ